MIEVISVCHDANFAILLGDSLLRNGWRHSIIETEWKGFGTKLIKTYEYLKSNPGITEFIFVDTFDVVCLGGEVEFRDKMQSFGDASMIVSAERGLWPPTMEKYRELYTKHHHRFNYANSGSYYAKSENFLALMENDMPEFHSDDQAWINLQYINQPLFFNIKLDNDQKLFNSHSFIEDGEYGYENNRVQINGNEPVFIHSNGRSVDPKLNEMLKNII